MVISITIKIGENIHVTSKALITSTNIYLSASLIRLVRACDVMYAIHVYATRGHYLLQRYVESNIALNYQQTQIILTVDVDQFYVHVYRKLFKDVIIISK
jgi:hypothetical protein